ncbi:PUL domain protein, partial [Oesophagostomum dentatum]
SFFFKALLLNGHKLSVWALAAIEASPGYYLSGSADKTIKLWHDDNEVRTYTGHTDVVRALLVISTDRFLSAANDSTIRLWHTETGVCLAKFSSLVDEFIFSLTVVDDYVVSCSEGGYVEVWKQSTTDDQLSLSHAQLIHSPAMTLWAVRGLPNGDIVAAASDGRIYVYTQDKNRKAPEAISTAYEDAVAAKVAKELERKERQASETVVIKVSLDDGAPNMELRYKKGTDPALAAEKFIQDYDLPVSYLNEITDYIKAHIPEAAAAALKQHKSSTNAASNCGRKGLLLITSEYDCAFDVTVDDGRKLRLPYNLSEDPDVAAQRFVEKHNLPVSFLAKVSGLLRSQTGASSTSQTGQFYDPFTGSGRYVPGEASNIVTNGAADPLTGSGRYIPGSSRGDSPAIVGGDPLTGSGRYKPGSAPAGVIPISCIPLDKKRPRGELVPMSNYFRFGVEQLSSKAFAKLVEVNNTQTALKLSEAQLEAIHELMSASTSINHELLATALETGLQWSIEDLVPILDVFRVALLDETLNTHFCDMKARGEGTQQRLTALLLSEPPDAVSILVCRSMTNAFAHSCGREMLSRDFQTLFTVVSNQLTSNKAALQLAAASALANWSLLLLQRSEKVAELGPREDAIRAFVKLCDEKLTSFGSLSEAAMIRLLQAIVTFMWGDTTVISLAKSRNMLTIINRMKDAVVDERGKNIARDIAEMIYAV